MGIHEHPAVGVDEPARRVGDDLLFCGVARLRRGMASTLVHRPRPSRASSRSRSCSSVRAVPIPIRLSRRNRASASRWAATSSRRSARSAPAASSASARLARRSVSRRCRRARYCARRPSTTSGATPVVRRRSGAVQHGLGRARSRPRRSASATAGCSVSPSRRTSTGNVVPLPDQGHDDDREPQVDDVVAAGEGAPGPRHPRHGQQHGQRDRAAHPGPADDESLAPPGLVGRVRPRRAEGRGAAAASAHPVPSIQTSRMPITASPPRRR